MKFGATCVGRQITKEEGLEDDVDGGAPNRDEAVEGVVLAAKMRHVCQ